MTENRCPLQYRILIRNSKEFPICGYHLNKALDLIVQNQIIYECIPVYEGPLCCRYYELKQFLGLTKKGGSYG